MGFLFPIHPQKFPKKSQSCPKNCPFLKFSSLKGKKIQIFRIFFHIFSDFYQFQIFLDGQLLGGCPGCPKLPRVALKNLNVL